MPVYPTPEEHANGYVPAGSVIQDQELNAQLDANGYEHLQNFEPSFWDTNSDAIGGIVSLLALVLTGFAIFKMTKKFKITRAHFALDTQVKRAAFIVLIIGVVLMTVGVLDPEFYFDSESFVRSVSFSHKYSSVPTFGVGFYLTIVGLFSSYLFDYTIGPLARWVKQGRQKN